MQSLIYATVRLHLISTTAHFQIHRIKEKSGFNGKKELCVIVTKAIGHVVHTNSGVFLASICYQGYLLCLDATFTKNSTVFDAFNIDIDAVWK